MTDADLRERAHDVDVTVWVGKGGTDPVADELDDQLGDRDLVKAKFLRAARGGTDVDTLADELAERTGAAVVETRGNTATFHR